MKGYIILALMLAASFAATENEAGSLINFNFDPNPESPMSLLMRGTIDPVNQEKSEMTTFLRLAQQLIPLAESAVSDEHDGGLKLTRFWCYGGTGEAFSLCVFGYAELVIGWKVSQIGDLAYNLTYTPYTYLTAGGNATAGSYPAEVAYGVFFSITEIEIPTNILLSSSQVCWSSKFVKYPTALYTVFNANLLQCQRSIPDMTPWGCQRIEGAGFRHLEYSFDFGATYDLLEYSCFNF